MSVTFLIPVFGVLWGILFLDEPLTLNMVAGCAVILLGTSLSTGMLAPGKRANASAGSGASNKDSLLRPDR